MAHLAEPPKEPNWLKKLVIIVAVLLIGILLYHHWFGDSEEAVKEKITRSSEASVPKIPSDDGNYIIREGGKTETVMTGPGTRHLVYSPAPYTVLGKEPYNAAAGYKTWDGGTEVGPLCITGIPGTTLQIKRIQ